MAREFSEKEKLERVFGIHQSENIQSFSQWTEQDARALADSMGLQLSDQHWEVIRFLRVYFENVGDDLPPAHEFSQTLEQRFSDQGGLRHLYELFPDGPLNQGGKIAGIAIPADTRNTSLGSVH